MDLSNVSTIQFTCLDYVTRLRYQTTTTKD